MPGVAVAGSPVITSIVQTIDLWSGTFSLCTHYGEMRGAAARDPQNPERAAVGDRVTVATRESPVITVSRPLLDR